ncbi:hypothetical protein BJ875DRAFT_482169 [Amylocarpus encephaloides]|uniref:Uncharacterized protein n=1 Tax=Amylocarpus encephaloides TaxID=45428 RepID=A0A9P7YNL5_9HELO|nr:hypothetical protein BJ875DRAFT_482169 [Amylocarpus encephaloides]
MHSTEDLISPREPIDDQAPFVNTINMVKIRPDAQLFVECPMADRRIEIEINWQPLHGRRAQKIIFEVIWSYTLLHLPEDTGYFYEVKCQPLKTGWQNGTIVKKGIWLGLHINHGVDFDPFYNTEEIGISWYREDELRDAKEILWHSAECHEIPNAQIHKMSRRNGAPRDEELVEDHREQTRFKKCVRKWEEMKADRRLRNIYVDDPESGLATLGDVIADRPK